MAKPLKEYKLFNDFVRIKIGKTPSDRADLPIVDKKDEIVNRMESSELNEVSQLNVFRTIAEDRETQYNSYDEMTTDSAISAALEIYADDATAYDEKGRIIWVESEDNDIAKAGNRLLDILQIPERAWKHIHQACKYGDYYLKIYRRGELDDEDQLFQDSGIKSNIVKVVNDVRKESENDKGVVPPYEEYVEDVEDPATVFDLTKRGKTAGFIEVSRDQRTQTLLTSSSNIIGNQVFSLKDVNVYRPDRIIHIAVGETLTRNPETVTLDFGNDTSTTYKVNRGKSILYDVYPIQRELQLLEDSLLLNRLTRSSLIRLLEIEVGDMPKKEVNDYLRRIKQLIEQHVSMDKDTGQYKSFNAPGPIDNVIYIPVKNGKGHIDINNLGGDVNVRDIADVDYFNNKRAGALKIPRAYLGDDMDGSGLANGGSLVQLSIRYARTIKRIQTAYIKAITTMLNLFFIDKKLDYVNKFEVRMASPSTQEDLDRNELIKGNIELIDSIMGLLESFDGGTQKEILQGLVADVLKMPEIAEILKKDKTPEEDIDVEGDVRPGGGPDIDIDVGGGPGGEVNMTSEFEGGEETETSSPESGGFTDQEYSEFEDTL